MERINVILSKNLMYVFYVLTFVASFGWFRGCSTSKDLTKMRKELVMTNEKLDSIIVMTNNIDNKEDLDLKLEINGLEISKRLLYDENSIVRTKLRPDDRMNEYDETIKALKTELRNNQND